MDWTKTMSWSQMTKVVKKECVGYPNVIGELPELLQHAEEFFRMCKACIEEVDFDWEAQFVARKGTECITQLHEHLTALREWEKLEDDSKQQFVILEGVITTRKREIDECQRTLTKLQGEVTITNDELDKSRQSLEKTENDVTAAKAERRKLLDSVKKANKAIDNIRPVLKVLEKENDNSSAKKLQLLIEIEQLQKQMKDLQPKVQDLVGKDKLQRELQEVQRQLTKHETESSATITQLRSENKALSTQIDEEKGKARSLSEDHNSKVQELKEELQSSEDKLREKTAAYDALSTRLKDNREQVITLKTTLQEEQQKVAQLVTEQESLQKQLSEEKSKLDERANLWDFESVKFRDDIERLESDVRAQEERAVDAEARESQLHKKKQDVERDLAAEKREVQKFQSNANELRKERDQLQTEKGGLDPRLNDLEEEQWTLQERNTGLYQELKGVRKENDTRKELFDSLVKEHEEIKCDKRKQDVALAEASTALDAKTKGLDREVELSRGIKAELEEEQSKVSAWELMAEVRKFEWPYEKA